jgi:diguanylate cyclase (GGDEF)-like protein
MSSAPSSPVPSNSLHATLRRQLRRLGQRADALPADSQSWTAFLNAVGRAYDECDQLVYLVTRAERKSTDELMRSQIALAEAQRLAGLGSWSLVPGESLVLISAELARILSLDGHARQVTLEVILSRIDEAQREFVVRAVARASQLAVDDVTELRVLGTDGPMRWCQCRIRSRTDDHGRVTKIDGTFLDITERRSAEDTVKALAYLDPLTGLSNRTRFIEFLEVARQDFDALERPFALLFIDLDGFKAINDTMGHNCGDDLLKRIGLRLKDGVRASDHVGRFGGDEFLILLNGMSSLADVEQVAATLLRAMALPAKLAGKAVSVSASIGIAQYTSDTGTVNNLLRNADAAMYAAKQAGRNAYRVFSHISKHTGPREHVLVHALRQAILEDSLILVYQPIVDGLSGRMLGSEALSRWTHPEFGVVTPDVFIPMAERFGLMQALSRSMMRRACAQLRRLIDLGYPEQFMSLNVSPHQFDGDDLVRDLTESVAQAGIAPCNVQLEITEGAIMTDPRRAASILNNLADLGYRIALDDFGAGQSSLTYLRQLPVHCIKIDRSFISELTEDRDPGPILRAIVGMANGLKCETLPEGIETEAQRNQLLSLGCRWMQGYFFARPLAGVALEALLVLQRTGVAPRPKVIGNGNDIGASLAAEIGLTV